MAFVCLISFWNGFADAHADSQERGLDFVGVLWR